MTTITSYQWGDLEKTIVIGFVDGIDVKYIIPVDEDNKEYRAFVAIGTETAAEYLPEEDEVISDYVSFWIGLISSPYYMKVRASASTSLPVNVVATEFIALIGDAKNGLRIQPLIQSSFNELLVLVPPDSEDQVYLNNLMDNSGLSSVYALPFV